MTFTLKDTVKLDDKKCDALVFQHESGMKHIHINSTFPEMSFAACFPTATTDNTGMPHILEHMVMCGSQDYPQNDPFFSMTRRSVAHDLNAMTDRASTYYRFATTDLKDFNNLSDLYLDLVFRPLLRKKDYLREGWRLERDSHGQPKLNGVVLNEMLGAYSNPDRHIIEGMITVLGQGTAAEKMSGGHPLSITALDYESLKSFYQSRYFHGTSVIVTAGPIDVELFQRKLAKTISKLPAQTPSEPNINGVGLGAGVSPDMKFEFDGDKIIENGQTVKELSIPSESSKPAEAVWMWRGDYRPGALNELEDQTITAALFEASNPEFIRLCRETSLNWEGGFVFDSLARHGGKVGIYMSCSGVSKERLAELDERVKKFIEKSIDAGISTQSWDYSLTRTKAVIRTHTPMHNLAISMAGLAVNNLPLDCDTNNIKAANTLLSHGAPDPQKMRQWWNRFESAGIIMTRNDPEMMNRWGAELDKIARRKAELGIPFTQEREILAGENEDESVLPRVLVSELSPVIESMSGIKVIPSYPVDKKNILMVRDRAMSMPQMSSLWLPGNKLPLHSQGEKNTAAVVHIHSSEDDKNMRIEVQFDCQNLVGVDRLALTCLEILSDKLGNLGGGLNEKTERKMKNRVETHISTKATQNIPGSNPWIFSIVGAMVDPEVGSANIIDSLMAELAPNLNDEDLSHAIDESKQEVILSLDKIERNEEAIKLAANVNAAAAGQAQTEVSSRSLLAYMGWAKENLAEAREQIIDTFSLMLEQSPRRIVSVGDDRVLKKAVDAGVVFAAKAPAWQMIPQVQSWSPGQAARGHVHMPGGSHDLTRHMATPNLQEKKMMRLAAKVTAKLASPYLHTEIREKGGAYGSGMMVDTHAIRLMARNDPSPDQSYEAFTNLSQWIRKQAQNQSQEALEQAKIGVARDLVNPGRGLVGMISALSNINHWSAVDYISKQLRDLEKIGWEQISEVADLLDPSITPFQDITVGPHEPKPLPEQKRKMKVN